MRRNNKFISDILTHLKGSVYTIEGCLQHISHEGTCNENWKYEKLPLEDKLQLVAKLKRQIKKERGVG